MDINLDLTPWQSEFSNAIKPQLKPWRVEIRQWYKTSARRNSRKLASASWSLRFSKYSGGCSRTSRDFSRERAPPSPTPEPRHHHHHQHNRHHRHRQRFRHRHRHWHRSRHRDHHHHHHRHQHHHHHHHHHQDMESLVLEIVCYRYAVSPVPCRHFSQNMTSFVLENVYIYILAFLSLPDASTFFFSVAPWQKFPGKPQLLPGNYFWLLSRWAQHLTWLLRPVLANSWYLDMERLVLEICLYLRVWSGNATDISLLTLKIRLPFLLSPTPLVFVIHPRPQVCMLTNSKGQKFGML